MISKDPGASSTVWMALITDGRGVFSLGPPHGIEMFAYTLKTSGEENDESLFGWKSSPSCDILTFLFHLGWGWEEEGRMRRTFGKLHTFLLLSKEERVYLDVIQ